MTAWFDATEQAELHLSCLTVGEIRRGIERLRVRDEVQARAIDRWLAGLRLLYQDRVVPVDAEIADRWGRINSAATLPVIDGLLAATALTRDWTIVTRNVTDFHSSGARVLNPWEQPAAG